MNHNEKSHSKVVVHARIGREAYEALEAYANRKGCSLTHALRELLRDLKQRELEDGSASRLEAISRSLLGIAEQQARHASRIEALVAILRKVEEGQEAREAQILETLATVLGLDQLAYAHLLGIVESSPRAADITASAQAKIRALQNG
ncbi:MAG: hypothetical protein JST24_05350 [Acidobacteria bacterium]|nr:hypothetical protein [Acidobacteriota bacterium]